MDQIKQNVLNKLSEGEEKLLVIEFEYLEKNFCGNVINSFETMKHKNSSNLTNIYASLLAILIK